MAKLTFPAATDGLKVSVVVGLDGQTTTDLFLAGQPIPAPPEVPGIVDSGSDVTAVAPWIIRQLGISHGIPAVTQTASGLATVTLYLVSITIRDALQPGAPEFTIPTLLVMGMPNPVKGVEALVGLDVLMQCNFYLEGPQRRFSFEF